MQDARRELRLGWEDARWTLYLAVLLLPTVGLALAIASLIDGRIAEPPSPTAWGLGVAAALISFYGAGLWDGFSGRLGRHVWAVTILAIAWRSIRSIHREAARAPGNGHELRRRTRIRFAGNEVIVDVLGVMPSTPFRGISETIQRQLSQPAPHGAPRGITIEPHLLAGR